MTKTPRNSRLAQTIGQVDARVSPRYAGIATFARLPQQNDVEDFDVAILGVPFDSGVTFRPGARFAPAAIREASRLIKPYHPDLDVSPFELLQVVDAGDVPANPFAIDEALQQIEGAVDDLSSGGRRPVLMGGDHTIALPALRALSRRHGPLALVHFDAHLDTWDTYFGAEVTHGTPFRRAAEEGLLAEGNSMHIGTRGTLYSPSDLEDDAGLGFTIIRAQDFEELSLDEIAGRIRSRVGATPLYISIDIDVLDPAFAPGTGTPELGGLSSREVIGVLRRLSGLNFIGADVVEVAPAYDSGNVTSVAAAGIIMEYLALMAIQS
ncbi:agmatinase [uncultured Microbacterium sp.]|uniref:agmatinase n=1 Tax=uncultured Microbacterium sp. TaxID=191216 RepID=UPI0028D16111|nr:agmatinase [uncultured Microbacterium sp.]